jgi:DNA sulfur modification protein DndD
MKLTSLQLYNFRQFYGKTIQIKFASEQQNTTVIHGSNGAGKTALLNAFTWVLYEQFTAAFAAPEMLINKRAVAETREGNAVECWVELQFSSNYQAYQLKRKCYGIKKLDNTIEYSPSKLFMLVSGDDGKWYPPVESATEIIEQILPSSLHQYFFFDGERIDNFFRQTANNNIAEDTKELLGVKVLDRAIEHLRKAKKSLQDELQAIAIGEVKQLLKEYKTLEKKQEQATKLLNQAVEEITQLELRKNTLAKQLLEVSGADRLQQLKEKLTQEEKQTRKNILQAKKNLKEFLSRQGYLLLLPGVLDSFTQVVNNLKQEKQINTGIQKEFIDLLLQQQACLCGLELIPESLAYNNVRAWLQKVDTQNIEAEIIRLETQIKPIQNSFEQLWQSLDEQQAKINHQYLELNKIEKELEQINRQLRSYPDRDIQTLQKQLEVIDTRIKELILEQGITQQQLETESNTLTKLQQKLAKQQLKEQQQILTQKRIQATQEAIERLIEVRNRLETQFRNSLEQKVGEIFNSISFTPYIPKLNENYELTLVEETHGMTTPVAASTGENQILSLSFIGAIIDRVREWSQRHTLIGLDSSTFPIVMDSPFGSLDRIYRQQTAQAIPQLANQLIVLVTKTQWRGEVAETISDRIGQEYILTYHSSKPNCQEDWLTLHNVNYPLIKQSHHEFEYTEIVEIKS